MIQKQLIGNKQTFALEYAFFDGSHETELSIYVNGINILAFERTGIILTTRWNIDELAMWLRDFIDKMSDDPYPVDCEGQYAAQKDYVARDFDSDDDEIFEAYYQKLYTWNLRHRWHSASSGAILADVFFQQVGDYVEVSWDNRNSEDGIVFLNEIGGASIPKEKFYEIVDSFLKAYACHWFS